MRWARESPLQAAAGLGRSGPSAAGLTVDGPAIGPLVLKCWVAQPFACSTVLARLGLARRQVPRGTARPRWKSTIIASWSVSCGCNPSNGRQRQAEAGCSGLVVGETNAEDERLVIWPAAGAMPSRVVWACCIVLYNDAKLEDGMLRAGAMIALLGLAVYCAGCSKCVSPFGSPGACHSDASSIG